MELEDNASADSGKDQDETHNKSLAACVTFVKRSAAEKAFANAKSWQEHTLQLVWVTRQIKKENKSSNDKNNPSVSSDHLSSKNKSAASVSNDPKPEDEVKSSSTEEPKSTNVSGDDNTLNEQDNGSNKSNSESNEGAEKVAAPESDEEQMNG